MKTLVISHNSFSKTHNNGKTLSAIFSAFKSEELCQLYFTPIGRPDYERCMDYYLISDKDALVSIFRRKHCGTQLSKEPDIFTTGTPSTNKKKSRPNNAKKYLRTVIWMLSSWYKGGLKDWIAVQKPDAIFYVGGDGVFSHRIAVKLSKILNLPLATYFTDDYIINPPSDYYNKLLKRSYKRTIDCSEKLFAIGKKMADDYTVYYNREFMPIMNIVDIPLKEDWKTQKENNITINYFGGLHLGRAEEIMRFARFMCDKVKDNLKRSYDIGIYSFASLSEEELKEMKDLGIVFHQGLTGVELADAMRRSDILLHVESVNKEFHSLTKLSVSTKIPEYMCLTKPVIAFGPADVASFSVIAEATPEMVLDDVDDTKVMNKQAKHIIDILNSDEYLTEIADCNYHYAKLHFDRAIVAQEFRNAIMGMLV